MYVICESDRDKYLESLKVKVKELRLQQLNNDLVGLTYIHVL